MSRKHHVVAVADVTAHHDVTKVAVVGALSADATGELGRPVFAAHFSLLSVRHRYVAHLPATPSTNVYDNFPSAER